MKDPLKLFHYHELTNSSKKVIFLFHGTGGNETDLLSLTEPFQKTHNIVGLLGNVSEHGMARFFKRDDEGVFDQENIKQETEKLSLFIKAWIKKNKIDPKDITYIGYSNGANFILAELFNYPELVYKAALLHAMLPFAPEDIDLSQKRLFFSWGQFDTVILPFHSKKTVEAVQSMGAQPTVVITPSGHNITSYEVEQLHNFINK